MRLVNVATLSSFTLFSGILSVVLRGVCLSQLTAASRLRTDAGTDYTAVLTRCAMRSGCSAELFRTLEHLHALCSLRVVASCICVVELSGQCRIRAGLFRNVIILMCFIIARVYKLFYTLVVRFCVHLFQVFALSYDSVGAHFLLAICQDVGKF